MLLYSPFKRICDFFLSFLCLFLLSPFLIVIYFCVLTCIGSPVFFLQKRLGILGTSFNLIKFRTMTMDVDSMNILLPDNQRITRFGSFLRSTSIDELPSLLNILQGSMSFVGPRPMPLKYYPRFDDEQLKRLRVKPGLTGLAQINGRNDTTWSKRFSYDIEYVRYQSLLLDFSILLKTIFAVCSRKGINNSLSVTMPEFTGDN